MLVKAIDQKIITEGEFAGRPCIALISGGDIDISIENVYEDVLRSKLTTVVVVGKLSEEPELKTLITNLTKKGKFVVFITSAAEDVTPLRTCRNLKFTLKVAKAPNSKENTVNQRSLNVLQVGDEIIISLKNIKQYEEAKEYLKGRVITNPTVTFGMNPDFKTDDEHELFKQYFGHTNEEGVQIPGDAEKFVFRTRVARPLNFDYGE